MDNVGRNLIIGIVAVAVLGFLGFTLFGNNDGVTTPLPSVELQPAATELPGGNEIIVNLQEQNNSTQSGQAVLREENGQVVVTLSLQNASSTVEEPAHIHVGSCPEPGAIRYPLSNVVNGRSETTISTTLNQLLSEGPLAINVHESPEALQVYVACGNLPTAPTTSGS